MRRLHLEKLYPITDSRNRNALSHAELAQEFLEAGIRFFQVREKEMPDGLLYEQLLQIQSLCQPVGAQFLVNDRVDLALAAGAHGVHLGQDDLPVQVARRLLGNEAIIGLSTHTREQFLEAQSEDIDYVAIGPVFATATKTTADPTLGIERIRSFTTQSRHPVVAIGGISLETAPQLWAAGTDSVAVVSDIVNCSCPRDRVSEYLESSCEH